MVNPDSLLTVKGSNEPEGTDYRAGKRCYNYNGVHIPGCWGCVIYGHTHCTCSSPVHRDIAAKMRFLERRIAKLERESKNTTE